MPDESSLIRPRAGHIDLIDGIVNCPVGLSIEVRQSPTGEQVTLLHLDVGVSDEVETPLSVGIPLTVNDATILAASLAGVSGRQIGRNASDRLN